MRPLDFVLPLGPFGGSMRALGTLSLHFPGTGRVAAAVALGLALVLPALPATAKKAACPAGMVNVLGRFCVDAFEASVDVVDSKGSTVRRHSPYHVPKAGERLRSRSRRNVVPQAHISQEQAQAACEAAGKRLCSDQEWITACRGQNGTRYPYGEEHEAGRCHDKGVSPLRKLHGAGEGVEVFGIDPMNDPRLNQIPGTVAKTGQHKGCKTSSGAYDMVGNLHEWTADPAGTFRGGYYLDNEIHGRGCDYLTTGHNTKYRDYSIGFRCCRSLDGEAESRAARSKREEAESRGKGPTRPASAKSKRKTHVVAQGESLGKIAKRYDTTVGAICERNGIERNAVIRPGDELTIPE